MGFLKSSLVVMLGSILCCGRLSYLISSDSAINHAEASPLLSRHHQRHQSAVFGEQRRHRLQPPASAIQLTAGSEQEENAADEMDAVRIKRLVGLLRCSGWGSSCSRLDYGGETAGPRQPASSQRSRYNAADAGEQPMFGGVDRLDRPIDIDSPAGDRQPSTKFQPFFTLTSGKNPTIFMCS